MDSRQAIAASILLVLLVGCGGGGGGGNTRASASDGSEDSLWLGSGGGNRTPIVDAGSDIAVFEQTDVRLQGSATDSDGLVQAYAWLQETGPTVTLVGADQPTLEFVAPDVMSRTVMTFRLTATDDDGAGGIDRVSVTVEPLEEIAGVISADTTLAGEYLVVDSLQVAAGVTVTILPGTALLFAPDTELVVAGTLLADGSVANPIFFSYLRLAPNPQQSWRGIRFESSTNSSLTNSVIENAASGVNLDGVSIVPIAGNLFRSNGRAITDDGGYQVMQVSGNTFADNLEAISGIRTSGASAFESNVFTGNPEVFKSGYYFDATTISNNLFEGATLVIEAPADCCGHGSVTATDNWWGTTDTGVIDELIIDAADDVTLQSILYVPFLDAAPGDAGSGIAAELLRPAP